MAQAIAKGAKSQADRVQVKRVENVTNQDLLAANGIIVGSPVYFGQMTAKVKHMFDDSVAVHKQLEGKVGAAFTSSGGTASGAETTLLGIVQAMLVHGMIVQGNAEDKHYGVAVQGSPKAEDLQACEALGSKVAKLVSKLTA